MILYPSTCGTASAGLRPAYGQLPSGGLFYHFNDLRLRSSLDINDFPIPISSLFLCFKRFLWNVGC